MTHKTRIKSVFRNSAKRVSHDDRIVDESADVVDVDDDAVRHREPTLLRTHGQTERDGDGVHALGTDGEEEWFFEVGGRGVGTY